MFDPKNPPPEMLAFLRDQKSEDPHWEAKEIWFKAQRRGYEPEAARNECLMRIGLEA